MAEGRERIGTGAVGERGRLLGGLLRLLRVPPPPTPPAGSPESVRVFRAAPGFYRYRLLTWGLGQVGAVWGLVAGLTFVSFLPDFVPGWIVHTAEGLAVTGFAVQLPFTLLLVKLDFEYRWYVVTDRSLRIREGIVRVREQTMSFANVQNLAIHQGPLQRLFGISDLRVRTAGGGGKSDEDPTEKGSKNLHLGYFRGVDRAEEVRDAILRKLRRHRDAGLGDPEEAAGELPEGPERPAPEAVSAAPGTGTESPALAAARELLAEARALRASLPGAAR